MTFYDLILSSLKKKLGIDSLSLETPRDKSFGDFATTIAMQIAKLEAKNPREVAAALLPKIQELDFIEAVSIAGPGFINIKIKNDFIIKHINKRFAFDGTQSTIDLDYGGYNVAKDLHIGHLRPSIIGDAVYRIARFLGHRPISYNYIGDWGRPMAMVIAWVIKNNLKITPKKLNSFYPAASQYAKDHPDFMELVQKIKKEFQDGAPEYVAIYENFLKISLNMMDKVIKRLNMLPFDNTLGERNAAKYLTDVEKILRDKKLLKQDDGAMIVELKQDSDTAPMPPFMFYDSRGADTYDATDLATIYYRKITDNPDKIIYFTDVRQQLHFEQLFRAAEMSGIFLSKNLEHQYCGAISGFDGKPLKTRDGNVPTLNGIIDIVEAAVRERDNKLPEKTVKMIALAALKFNDLMHDIKSDYIFDPKAVTSFEGRTGPYILYTAVRLKNIFSKAKLQTIDLIQRGKSELPVSNRVTKITNSFERSLLLKLLEFPRMIQITFDKRSPDILANYTYDLCQLANAFYHDEKIADNPNRLAITKRTVKILGTCINLMGLKIPKEM